MERRKAFVLAGAVTISALTGASALGASAGVLGFGGNAVDHTAAASSATSEGTDSGTVTRVIHVPGPAPARSADVGVRTSPIPSVGAPSSASLVAPTSPSEGGDSTGSEPAASPIVTAPAPAPVVGREPDEVAEPGNGTEIERPEAPETEDPEDRGSPERDD